MVPPYIYICLGEYIFTYRTFITSFTLFFLKKVRLLPTLTELLKTLFFLMHVFWFFVFFFTFFFGLLDVVCFFLPILFLLIPRPDTILDTISLADCLPLFFIDFLKLSPLITSLVKYFAKLFVAGKMYFFNNGNNFGP